ncbi:phosphatidate cytidylyltransferase [Pseudoramibacter sp.]|jgi:phosphatidate cytidylyltransferase|uniref:phosphatidate cytidylyltransferase n=1 Tax=Pseudoramibacter sp. TaxID=2034862 RepID=UPI0025DE3F01|nr:phosphatidate cytidylyltransferase [Pseudoramibacter sp.]MCH4073169.1 phosphatidate cytidylyltransferase [Pseudoramibacter sp.]MCH4106941.1 phosphatidate cytidylyltransferase [Pseudoramibacter sp.]
MAKRIITAVIFVPILAALLILGGYFVFGLTLFLTLVGTYEYVHAVNKKLDQPIHYALPLILAALLVIVMKFDYQYTVPALLIAFIVVFMAEVLSKEHSVHRAIATVFGLVYLPLMLGHLQLFDAIPQGLYYLWLVFIIAFVTDTGAYFIGKFFGKTPLIPEISPHKTVAGSVGGTVAAVALTVAYGILMRAKFNFDLPIYAYAILGIVGSIVSQFGDLTASLIKRNTDIKDYGKLLPGHGGVLDRFDSVIFVLPIVYLFAMLTFTLL